MNKSTVALALLSIFAGVAIGSYIQTIYYPQTASIVKPKVLVLLEGIEWQNGTLINWTKIIPTVEYSYNLTVCNVGEVNFTVAMIITGLPAGWTETWTANNTQISTIAPSNVLCGWLNLTASQGSQGSYNWDSWINLNEA